MDLTSYNYHLPSGNLALSPVSPRDHSKLFIYDTKLNKVTVDLFYNVYKYLPASSFLVLNETKVVPCRVTMKKRTGGKIVVLLLVNKIKDGIVSAMVDRKAKPGEELFFENGQSIEVISQKENIFQLRFSFSKNMLFEVLGKEGVMPVPPYLKKTLLKKEELVEKYQTVFAKVEGSSAAPTASFHFTDRVFRHLDKAGIKRFFVTLHVGLGTFAPLTEDNLKSKKLHLEHYEIKKPIIEEILKHKKQGDRLVAVGTTVTRTLESYAKTKKISDMTDLFIYHPYDFRMVDHLLTNFHLPRSSLMMLVEAFLKQKKAERSLIELYNMAIKKDFRFYSFGDAMLIL